MGDLALAAAVVVGYLVALVGVARWAERQEARGRRIARNPFVYSLSLAVYATTWTFYGSVGFAARHGLLFLAVYLGPTLVFAAAWWLVRPLIRLKSAHGVTGLPDLLALLYARSQLVALVATLVLVVGLVPYLALQLRTMMATLVLAARSPVPYPEAGDRIGPPLVALLVLFTIVLGLQRIRPAERHPGLVVAVAVECIVKLGAFLVAGAFVVWGLFDGPVHVFRAASGVSPSLLEGHGVFSFLCHLLISAVAVLLLPRQFHVTVVENSDESHLRTAMWLFPAYLLVTNVFVLPLALGALALRGSAEAADTFVLSLPLDAGEGLLSWGVFIGGFSAGIGMVVVETTALATMVTNTLVLPASEAWAPARALRGHLVRTRWAVAAAVLTAAYVYERAFGSWPTLVSIGFVSFAAVLQIAPALVAGFVWRGASRAGALAGMLSGAAVWAYTLVVPVLARSGWLPASLLVEGPFGIELLAPEGLLDVHLDPVSHTVVWSLVANVGALVAGSLLSPPGALEAERTRSIVAGLEAAPERLADEGAPLARYEEKRERTVALLSPYFGPERAAELADSALRAAGASPGRDLSALAVAELEAQVEAVLAAAIGNAGAHAAVRRAGLVTAAEAQAVSRAYADVLASMHVPPAELKRRIDYHRERERLLERDAANQRFLAAVSAGLGASLDLEEVARTAVQLPVPHLADAALIFVPGGGAGPPCVRFTHREPELARAGSERLPAAAAEIGRVPAMRAALALQRMPPGPTGSGWPASLRPLLPPAVELVLPLAVREEPVGALALFAESSSRLSSADDVALAEELARRVAIAAENARIFRGVEEAVRARDQFLAVASHELKTPLTPLRLRIRTLEKLVARGELASLPKEKLAHLFTGAEEQVVRVAHLVDQLLDVTRMSMRRLRLAPEPMDLRETVTAVVERHRGDIARSRCTVRVHAPDPVTGRWDRLRLEQVTTNLLTNALKYAPAASVEVRVEAKDDRARLVVRDEGPGISPEDQARIFRPFERGTESPRVAGFGLGLFIVREIVEAHGGTLRLESEPGRGSTFTVELPRGAPEE